MDLSIRYTVNVTSTKLAHVYLSSNNSPLGEVVKEYLVHSGLRVGSKESKQDDYRVFIQDLNCPGGDQVSGILDKINSLGDYSGKICFVVANSSQVNQNSLETTHSLIASYLGDNRHLDLRLIQAFDLYSIESEEPVSNFHQWLCSVTRDRKVVVSVRGENRYYPTAVSDLCDLIKKTLFITNTAGETFTAASEEMTDLEIAYLLKKSLEKGGQQLDIDLTGKNCQYAIGYFDLSIQTQALLNWLPKINLSDQIDKLVQKSLLDNRDSVSEESDPIPEDLPKLKRLETINLSGEKPNTKNKFKEILSKFGKIGTKMQQYALEEENVHQTEKRGAFKIFRVIIVAIVFILVLPLFSTIFALYFSTTNTYRSYQQIRSGNEPESRRLLDRAKWWSGIASSSFQTIAPFASFVTKDTVTSTNNFITILGHGQTVLDSILSSYSLGDQLYQGLIGKKNTDNRSLSSALKVNLVILSEKLSQIQLLIPQINLPFGYDVKIKSSDINQQINLLKSQISLGIPLLDILNKVSTDLSLQRYLLIVQDPNELRPSGGFITTFAVITFEQGRINDIKVDSSFSLDRLVEGKIEPPDIVRKLLGQDHWAFRDSNLNADFVLTAKQITWFYQRFQTGSLDGLVGLNLNFFKLLLGEIGQISLPDGQNIDKNNLNLLASNPLSSQGLDIVTALTQTLSQRLLKGEIKFVSFARAILKTISYNEINLWFNKPELEELSLASQLSGQIKPIECHPQLSLYDCHPDTIHLNESNFSVNKLNYYLKRSQNYLIEIKDNGEVAYTVIYDYSYPVPSPTDLGQVYKAYYQLYLPVTARNLGITLDGQVQAQNQLLQSVTSELVKTEFSTVQATNQPHRLVIKFTSGHILDMKKPLISQSFSILKQPGTMNDPLAIKIIYPSKLQPRIMTLPFRQSGAQELNLQIDVNSQENIGVLFKNLSL